MGIVVDDAVVVGENIIAEQEAGLKGMDAAKANKRRCNCDDRGHDNSRRFAPLEFVSGFSVSFISCAHRRNYRFNDVLSGSVSNIACSFNSRGQLEQVATGRIQQNVSTKLANFRDATVLPLVERAIQYRKTTILISVVFFLSAMALIPLKLVRFEFLPSIESTRISASLAFPIGTPFEVTQAAAEKLVTAAEKVNAESEGSSPIRQHDSWRPNIDWRRAFGEAVTMANHLASIQIRLNQNP